MGWTSIYQLFWCELQGYKVLTHCHIYVIHRLIRFSIGQLPPRHSVKVHRLMDRIASKRLQREESGETSSGREVYLRGLPGNMSCLLILLGFHGFHWHILYFNWTPKHLRRFLNRRNLNKARHILQTCGSLQEKWRIRYIPSQKPSSLHWLWPLCLCVVK